jgi:phenylacetate-CoA ligase
VQPILRYDLGDAMVTRPTPCPCGNPLPAIQVQGRVGDTLTFAGADGRDVVVRPWRLVDRTPGVELFQLLQTSPTWLRVRLRYASGADQERVWRDVGDELHRLLRDHGLAGVTIERADELPEQSPGGNYRTVLPLRPRTRSLTARL